ncbi:MAG: hypothetical protein IPJ43_10375 [Saprospiraceae bacterium]|nr:hypothetical protein [Saprospiraceae bacterium]
MEFNFSSSLDSTPQYGNVPKDVYKANVIYLRVKSYEDLGKEDLWNFANAYINLKCFPRYGL